MAKALWQDEQEVYLSALGKVVALGFGAGGEGKLKLL
jgi:hypothetical protein